MAQYYAEIQGNRGAATRTGSKASGIEGHIRGWNVGAQVVIQHEDGRDVVYVYHTSGSSGNGSRELVARFSAKG